jgi:hypothetical protein
MFILFIETSTKGLIALWARGVKVIIYLVSCAGIVHLNSLTLGAQVYIGYIQIV